MDVTLEMIKNAPNQVWELYRDQIELKCRILGRQHRIEEDELLSEAYIVFVELCRDYDPNYQGLQMPFDRDMFKKLQWRLRQYVFTRNRDRVRYPSVDPTVMLQKETPHRPTALSRRGVGPATGSSVTFR